MASATTLTEWLEKLAISILHPSSTTKPRTRRPIENFRRRVRHHNFARTNQFDVSDRLDGLEEKFQVLNRDDLSDALFRRRIELRQHHDRWIPDVLDLLLRLSDNPIQKTKLDDVDEALPTTEPPHLLKWADIEGDEPFDRHDPIWKAPDFSDLSSDEDEINVSTADTTPSSARHRERKSVETPIAQPPNVFENVDLEAAELDLQCLRKLKLRLNRSITEIQMIRQIFLIAQGYPSHFFQIRNQRLYVDPLIKLENVSVQTFQTLIEQLWPTLRSLLIIREWLREEGSSSFIHTMKQSGEQIVFDYMSSICGAEEHMIHPNSTQTASILQAVSKVQEFGTPLIAFADWINSIENNDPVFCLEVLYDKVCEHYFTGDSSALHVFLPIFVDASIKYLKPIEAWLNEGSIVPSTEPFFVHHKNLSTSASNLWHERFELSSTGPSRPPAFMTELAQTIFVCGKTVCYINHIIHHSQGIHAAAPRSKDASSLAVKIHELAADRDAPFPAAFSQLLSNHFSSLLTARTVDLRHLLESRVGMNKTLYAFEHIYLRKQGALLDAFESRIFNRIDRCADNWNDRFLVADMLEDVYANVDCVDLKSITVHAAHTSSRSMESRRRSVRILGALAIDYTVPWPVANIISSSALLAYRRVALHLLQIRRAKYILDRGAYAHVRSTPISDSPRDQLVAQTTTFMLVQFANTLYNHFTTSIALPMTTRMHKDLATASNVDAMIAVHETYITNLEFACLTSKQLKLLRETLIGLLDMCIRFADLVSTPAATASGRQRGNDDDSEIGSFISAQSRRRGQRRSTQDDVQDSSDEDEEDDFANEGEGYSSFIVLDEDTTVVQEIQKLRIQFQRQLDFFIAGLRGVGRGGESVEEFEILADRLEWKVSS